MATLQQIAALANDATFRQRVRGASFQMSREVMSDPTNYPVWQQTWSNALIPLQSGDDTELVLQYVRLVATDPAVLAAEAVEAGSSTEADIQAAVRVAFVCFGGVLVS